MLIGANDLGDGRYASAQAWLDALWAYVATLKAGGTKVAVGTVLPICLPQYASYNTTHAARRGVVNEAIRKAVGTRIDAVIDFAADPDIGPDQAACNTAWFHDGLHPSDYHGNYQGGQGRMAAIYTTTMEPVLK